MKIKRYVILFFLFLGMKVHAQDPQFSQYYSTPLYMNPGFTGSTPVNRLVFNSRIQWPDLPRPYLTVSASFDRNLSHLNSGIGILMVTEKAGSADMKSTQVGFSYAYKINLAGNWIVSPGLLFSYGNRGIDYSKLIFGDQLEVNGPTSDDMLGKFDNTSYFDFSSGILIYNKAFWGGISLYHMNEPNHSLVSGESRLPVKMTLHSGIRIPVGSSIFSKVRKRAVTPSFIYKKQGSFEQLDMGISYLHGPVHLGAWYRGIPLEKNSANTFDHDAVSMSIGLQINNLTVGYSYDFTISKIIAQSGGSHEVAIVLEFPNQQNTKKKVERKNRFLPCPAFNWTDFVGQN